MANRMLLRYFSTDNPVYGCAQVSVWLVDPATGKPTQTLAPLYSDPFSATRLGNPMVLTGQGRWPHPVYVDAPCMMVATPAANESGAGVLQTYLSNVPPPVGGWGANPG